MPDSGVSPHEHRLADCLRGLLTPGTTLVAPWDLDPHPDHEACGRAAARAAEKSNCRLVSYFFWAWHRFMPDAIQSLSLRRFDLDPELCAAKISALAEYRSQLQRETGEPILPDLLLAPARRNFETFLLHD
jgi:LmbE family N-acetylglucosaminyl deacetylase